jgi:hypothetical protein
MTIWCVHPVKDDLTPALAYGPIKYVNTRYIWPDDLESDCVDGSGPLVPPQTAVESYQKAALEFDPAADYLVIAGDHLQLVMFVGELACRHGRFKVLRYDRLAVGYLPVEVQCRRPYQ